MKDINKRKGFYFVIYNKQLHQEFKAASARNGKKMYEVIETLMREYVKKSK